MSELRKLIEILQERNERISKAKRVRSLLEMQKGLIRKKQSLTDFAEPVLFLVRRDGKMDMYEKATAGKFIFEHSTGRPRFIELRPADQITFDYGDKKVRSYVAHEDRPYTGWDEPVVDGETVMLGYEKTKATDLKYQQKMEELKNESKGLWVKIAIGCAIAIAIVAFAYNTWIAPSQLAKAEQAAKIAPAFIPILLNWKKRKTFK